MRVSRRLAAGVGAIALGIGLARGGFDVERMRQVALQRFGMVAAEAVDHWRGAVAGWRELPEEAQLQRVNEYFNRRIRFADDAVVWGQADYWATPVEALLKGAGDCEDFAIAKYISLRHLGVPAQKLRITYVKALRLNQAHMVLTYYPRPDAVPLVLDNLIGSILPASQRSDLQPVYAFNGEGLWLAGSGAGGGKQVGDSKRLSRWQDLLKKMKAEGFPSNE